MRGSIFVEFLDHVEQRYGMDTVDTIVRTLDGQLSTGGAYTSVGNYPHGELLAMAVTLCSLSGKEMPAVIHEFAGHLMGAFERMHPEYFSATDDVFEFLLSVEGHIHADVRKLYPDARPPLVRGARREDGALRLDYESTRPLAPLALSLAELAGDAFGQPLDVEVVDQDDTGQRITFDLRRRS